MTTVWNATPTHIFHGYFHWWDFKQDFFLNFQPSVQLIFVMHVYKHAQPALLYLVPACLGNILLNLLLIIQLNLLFSRGSLLPDSGEWDIKSMFQYEDHPNLEKKKTNYKSSCPMSLSVILRILVSEFWQFVVSTQKIEEPLKWFDESANWNKHNSCLFFSFYYQEV